MACNCWAGYGRVPGTKPCAPGSCKMLGREKAVQKLARGRKKNRKRTTE